MPKTLTPVTSSPIAVSLTIPVPGDTPYHAYVEGAFQKVIDSITLLSTTSAWMDTLLERFDGFVVTEVTDETVRLVTPVGVEPYLGTRTVTTGGVTRTFPVWRIPATPAPSLSKGTVQNYTDLPAGTEVGALLTVLTDHSATGGYTAAVTGPGGGTKCVWKRMLSGVAGEAGWGRVTSPRLTLNDVASLAGYSTAAAVEAAGGLMTADQLADHAAATDNPHQVTKAQVGLGNVSNDAQIPATEKGAAGGVAALDGTSKLTYRLTYEGIANGLAVLDGSSKLTNRLSYEGVANGVATLDSSAKLPVAQLPGGFIPFDIASGFDTAASDGDDLIGMVGRAITISSGQAKCLTTNPSATCTVTLYKDGVASATITISSTGVVATTGLPLSYAAGQAFKTSIANSAGSSGLRYVFLGTVN